MALATLSIDLEARLAKLDEGMNKAARLTEKQAARMDAALTKSRDLAVSVGSTIGGALGAAGLGRFVMSSIDAIDKMNDVKDATGAAIEGISALEDLALRTGGSIDDVSSILVKFNGVLKEADGKNSVSKALEAIGLSAAELKKLDPAEALRVTAVALSGFADDGTKARIVQDLFGKSVKEAAPFLKDLAEVGKLNGTVTTKQAEEAEKFNKQLFALKTNALNAGRAIASDLVPMLNKLFDKFKEGGIGGAVGFDKKFFDTAKVGVLAKQVNDLNALKASFEDGLRADPSNREYKRRLEEVTVQLDAAKAAFKSANTEFDRVKYEEKMAALMAPYVPREPRLPEIKEPEPTASGGAKAKRDDAAERYLESLQKQLEKTQELTVYEQVLLDLENKRLGNVDAGTAGRVIDLAEQIDQQKQKADLIESLGAEWDAVAQSTLAADQAAERWFESTMTPSEKLARQLKEINDLYQAGAFKSDEWGTAEQKRDRAIKKATESTNELSDAAKGYAQTMLQAIQNGDDLGEALEQLAMKAFIFDPLSKAIDGLFSGAGNPAAAGASSGGFNPLNLVGSLLSSVFGGFFADGGDPPVGKVSVVGERGPELFMPKSAGTIIPNKSLGGQSVQITQHISIGEGVSANGVMAAMVQTKAATVAEVMQVLRGRGVPV